MKKIAGILVLLLLIGTVFAAEERTGQETEIAEEIQDEASAQASVELCVKFLSEKYPNASVVRLNAICNKIKARVVSASSEDIGIAMRNRIRALENLNDAQKQKIMNMSSELKNKFEDLDKRGLEDVTKLNPEEVAKLKALGKSRLEKLASSRAGLKAELTKIRLETVKVEDLYRKRVVSEEGIEAAREKFEDAKERYSKAKANFTLEKERFQEAVKAREESKAVERAKAVLTHAADLVISSLEKIRSSIEDNDDISEEEAAEMIADIDARIKVMQDAKSKIEAAKTKEELKAAGEEIKDAWNGMKNKVRLHAGRVIKSKVSDVLERAEHLEVRMEKAISALEEEGFDVNELDNLSDEFSGHIADAREKFELAGEKFGSARELKESNSTQEEIDALISEGKELVKSAHDDLKEAHNVLKEILVKIREMKGNLDVIEETSEEIVVAQDPDDNEETEAENEIETIVSEGDEEPSIDENAEGMGNDLEDSETTETEGTQDEEEGYIDGNVSIDAQLPTGLDAEI